MSDLVSTAPAIAVLEEKRIELRARIKALEEHLGTLAQTELPLKHYFAKDLYVRELAIPQGTLVVGKIHKKEHVMMFTKGRALVLTEGEVKLLEAPATFECKPGTKRVVYAYEDTIWTTLHPNLTNERDLIRLEDDLIAKGFEELEQLTAEEIKQIGDAL